jgi:hypothetical protein
VLIILVTGATAACSGATTPGGNTTPSAKDWLHITDGRTGGPSLQNSASVGFDYDVLQADGVRFVADLWHVAFETDADPPVTGRPITTVLVFSTDQAPGVQYTVIAPCEHIPTGGYGCRSRDQDQVEVELGGEADVHSVRLAALFNGEPEAFEPFAIPF